MSTKTVDPDQVIVTFAGIPLSGFAEGTFINVSQDNESFNTTQGSDGELARVKSGQSLTTVTLTLMQTSDSNDALAALHTLDVEAPNGAGVGPFTISDLNGRSVLTSVEAWIKTRPDSAWGNEAQTREWEFHLGEPKGLFPAGN